MLSKNEKGENKETRNYGRFRVSLYRTRFLSIVRMLNKFRTVCCWWIWPSGKLRWRFVLTLHRKVFKLVGKIVAERTHIDLFHAKKTPIHVWRHPSWSIKLFSDSPNILPLSWGLALCLPVCFYSTVQGEHQIKIPLPAFLVQFTRTWIKAF